MEKNKGEIGPEEKAVQEALVELSDPEIALAAPEEESEDEQEE